MKWVILATIVRADMKITYTHLQYIYDCPQQRAIVWESPINKTLEKYEINTYNRVCMFLAQIGHESGRLRFVKEIWNPAQCPWQAKYEGRIDLGNTLAGDGERYMGRSFIQITGRANYKAVGDALGVDFVSNPLLLESRDYAVMAAGWYWDSRKLNVLADKEDVRAVTKKINGGYNGLEDRTSLYEKAKVVLRGIK